MNAVSFQNPGLIDPRCITTIGVSVKETDNPIGFFGTGLKYAIAILLRHGGRITIWRGNEPLRFDTAPIDVRGQEFAVVRMNGVELGFTVQLGKHWEMWQALREIWCNTKDEGGTSQLGEMPPAGDRTTIVVEQEAFADCYRHLDRYILHGATPVHAGKHVDFHTGPSSSIFYRSIKVGAAAQRPHLFPPNVIDKLDLTEDRTVKEPYQVTLSIAREIRGCVNETFLERWLTAPRDYAEHHIDLDWILDPPGEQFLRVVHRLAADTSRPLNITALKVMCKYMAPPTVVAADLLDSEREALDEAIAFCRELKYPVDEFPITVVESLGDGILGQASRLTRQILIARRAMQMGDLNLASTLIEEWVHLKHGHNDASLEMQNWLFDQVARLGQAYLHERAKRAPAAA